ncbi:hypothetical protein [Streptomyces sp. NPDC094468]|uniref:hypothetical protein n=1 Tax=Streptomyces sp. NPDC094468 TaxID=3366066 RepID=UPI0037F34CD5
MADGDGSTRGSGTTRGLGRDGAWRAVLLLDALLTCSFAVLLLASLAGTACAVLRRANRPETVKGGRAVSVLRLVVLLPLLLAFTGQARVGTRRTGGRPRWLRGPRAAGQAFSRARSPITTTG